MRLMRLLFRWLPVFVLTSSALSVGPAVFNPNTQPEGRARQYYVAPDGSQRGDGSARRPWPSAQYALEKVGGGNTIILMAGVYPGNLTIPARFGGTPDRPTEVRSEGKWKAAVIGYPAHGVLIQADYVVIDGLEVYGARLTGIKTEASHTTIRNCWIHNNYLQGVEAHKCVALLLERNLIEYNGISPAWHHGVYASGRGHRYHGNVVRWNASDGMHIWGDGGFSDSLISGNLCHDNAASQIHVSLADQGPIGPVLIAHNTCFGGRCGIRLENGAAPAPHAVLNNICLQNSELPIAIHSGKPTVTINYNLLGKPQQEGYAGYMPQQAQEGHNIITSAPVFVSARQSIFWLRPDSPARGIGTVVECTPSLRDFYGELWGGGPVDAGAFPFRPNWTLERAKQIWPDGYPYGCTSAGTLTAPDLWMKP
jgi:hypothetical protein